MLYKVIWVKHHFHVPNRLLVRHRWWAWQWRLLSVINRKFTTFLYFLFQKCFTNFPFNSVVQSGSFWEWVSAPREDGQLFWACGGNSVESDTCVSVDLSVDELVSGSALFIVIQGQHYLITAVTTLVTVCCDVSFLPTTQEEKFHPVPSSAQFKSQHPRWYGRACQCHITIWVTLSPAVT